MSWDLVVITAGDEAQRRDFELQIEEDKEELAVHTEKLRVIADEGDVRIGVLREAPRSLLPGSGGSTLNVLFRLFEEEGETLWGKRILLFHSGGKSQRMPTLSAFGKLFARLPNGMNVLQAKLHLYRSLKKQI